MEFKLIKSKVHFQKHINRFKESHLSQAIYNDSSDTPIEYPCLCYTYVNNDMNGLRAKSIFVYKKDFKLFSNFRNKV